MSVGRRSDFFTYINVRVEVPYGSYNKLMSNSTRLIMIWWHVVARKSAALHKQFEQFFLRVYSRRCGPHPLNSWPLAHELAICVVHCVLNVWM